jgi:hypothetical protein
MEAIMIQKLNLFDAGIAESVVKLARYLTPRTIWEMIRDCEGSNKQIPMAVGQALREYIARAWPDYMPVELPADPYMTVEGRFYRIYGQEEYQEEYLQLARSQQIGKDDR